MLTKCTMHVSHDSLARKTGIERHRIECIAEGLLPPSQRDIEIIAKAFGEYPWDPSEATKCDCNGNYRNKSGVFDFSYYARFPCLINRVEIYICQECGREYILHEVAWRCVRGLFSYIFGMGKRPHQDHVDFITRIGKTMLPKSSVQIEAIRTTSGKYAFLRLKSLAEEITGERYIAEYPEITKICMDSFINCDIGKEIW